MANDSQDVIINRIDDTVAKKGSAKGVYLYHTKKRDNDPLHSELETINYINKEGEIVTLIDTTNISTNSVIVNKADKCYVTASTALFG